MAKKFIKGAIKEKGALRKAMGAKEGEPIDREKMRKVQENLRKEAEGDKKLSPAKRKLLRRINLAQTLDNLRRR